METQLAKPHAMPVPPNEELPAMLSDYPPFVAINTGVKSDLRITCNGHTWNVHKAIVCPSSTFIQGALNFSVGKEAKDDCIDLPDDDPEIIRRMIVFMYAADYDPTEFEKCKNLRGVNLACSVRTEDQKVSKYHYGTVHPTRCACHIPTELQPDERTKNTEGPAHTCTDPLSIHATMYTIGDKYGVAGLCEAARRKFAVTVYSSEHLGGDDFIDAVAIAYSTTPDYMRGIRDEVVKCFEREYHVKLEKYPEIEANLEEFNTVSMKLLVALQHAMIIQLTLEE